jgi:hypothetical protein
MRVKDSHNENLITCCQADKIQSVQQQFGGQFDTTKVVKVTGFSN